MTDRIRILIAEDHTLVRTGLVQLLSLSPDIEVAGEVGDGRQACEQVQKLDPDVVLMDLDMPLLNGFETTREIKRLAPQVRILILSGYNTEEYILKTIDCGADGFLLKNSSPAELFGAIKAVYKGNAFYSPSISKMIVQNLNRKSTGTQPAGGDATHTFDRRLTAREREVLQLIAEGKSHQQIADLLFISVRTVDTHRNNMMQKLDLHDTASLVRYAIKNNIALLPR